MAPSLSSRHFGAAPVWSPPSHLPRWALQLGACPQDSRERAPSWGSGHCPHPPSPPASFDVTGHLLLPEPSLARFPASQVVGCLLAPRPYGDPSWLECPRPALGLPPLQPPPGEHAPRVARHSVLGPLRNPLRHPALPELQTLLRPAWPSPRRRAHLDPHLTTWASEPRQFPSFSSLPQHRKGRHRRPRGSAPN